MTANRNEFANYLGLIFALNPEAFTVKIPRGSTVGSRSRYYEVRSAAEVQALILQEGDVEYIKFWRDDVFYGAIYPEERYLKMSSNLPEISQRAWNILHTQNLGTYEIALRLTSTYFRNNRRQ